MADKSPTGTQTYPCQNVIPPFYPRAESWEEALRQHKENYITVIKNCNPISEWFRRHLANHAKEEIPIQREEEKYGLKLSIAEMQRMYMRALQVELVRVGLALQFKDSDENARQSFQPVMMAYTQAVRDYEYMMTGSRGYDYFVVSYERANDKLVLGQAVLDDYHRKKLELYVKKRDKAPATGPWEASKVSNPIGLTRRENEKNGTTPGFLVETWWCHCRCRVSCWSHVASGFETGSLPSTRSDNRLFFGFGLIMACFVDRVDQVFAGTLAYAAVLMVFVGLSIQGTEGK